MSRLVALVVGLLALALPAGAAAAVDAATVARALERSPLYVDPSFDDVVTGADRRRILAAIEARSQTVYVAIVGLRDGDRFDGDERAFLTALQARVRDSGALFVAFSQFSPRTASDDDGLDERGRLAQDLVGARLEFDAPIADQLVGLLDALELEGLRAQSEQAVARRNAEREAEASATPTAETDDAGEDEAAGGVPAWAVIVGGSVALAVLLGALLAGRAPRRRDGAPGAPPLLPERVFVHARAAHLEELRDRTRTEVIALAETIEATPAGKGAASAAYERAVEHAAAASKLHDRAARTVDFAGVLVLVDGGREALREVADLAAGRRHATARPLCFFDPLHGRSARDVGWAARKVAACKTCARAVRGGRDPHALRDDGRPWFEGDGALAATGMGQFADLPSRLARGDAP